MTPTLSGRFQTRIILFFLIGLPMTLFYSILTLFVFEYTPFLVLIWITIIGLILDPVWYFIQQARWERDWPFAFQFASSWVEFAIAAAIIWFNLNPLLPASTTIPNVRVLIFVVIHFSLVFWPSFLALLGFVQIFMIRWRFKGGEWDRFDPGTA